MFACESVKYKEAGSIHSIIIFLSVLLHVNIVSIDNQTFHALSRPFTPSHVYKQRYTLKCQQVIER